MYAYQWAGVSSCLLVLMSRSSSLCPKDHWNERMCQDLERMIFFSLSHRLHFSPFFPKHHLLYPIPCKPVPWLFKFFIFSSDLGVGTKYPRRTVSPKLNCPNSGVIPTTDID
ncbi:hypothetical protein ASPFODRAFT_275407 [Aspergillus luchuensis CBS 106.47]|uniref:Secreted protein n=1 Tax=Aspergillus luchuensis (strain CBS 106.47) TaxID=1137211 RepID=A0A1M3U153_ASPLC|nr:hypothetical protein ASPFODRAFT_275407 [Aspergillus luchuensis CBS 106.47]